MAECFSGKFNPPQCPKPAVWVSVNANNGTDGWTWCDDHVSCNPEYRERIIKEKAG